MDGPRPESPIRQISLDGPPSDGPRGGKAAPRAAQAGVARVRSPSSSPRSPPSPRSPSSPRSRRESFDSPTLKRPLEERREGEERSRPPKRVNSYSELNFGLICRVDSLASMALPELGAVEAPASCETAGSARAPPPSPARERWAPDLGDITQSPVAAYRGLGAPAAPPVDRAPAASPTRRSLRQTAARQRRRENSFSELGLVGDEAVDAAAAAVDGALPPSPPISIAPADKPAAADAIAPSTPVAVASSWAGGDRGTSAAPVAIPGAPRDRGFTESIDFGGFSPSPTRRTRRSASSWL